MKLLINRINDFVFKRIFGSEDNKDILLSFLNAVLKTTPETELNAISLLDREIDPEFITDKASRLDILAQTADGRKINIEVQIVNRLDTQQRSLYYWAKLYQSQLKTGQSYSKLTQTIAINILNFTPAFLSDSNDYQSTFHIREDKTLRLLCNDLEIHFLELPKMKALQRSPQNRLEKWLLYLNNAEGDEMEAIAMNEPMIRKALTCEEIFIKNEHDRRLYELREKAILDEISLRYDAFAEGKAEGMTAAQRDIAKKLLLRGATIQDIADITQLTPAEIEQLIKETADH